MSLFISEAKSPEDFRWKNRLIIFYDLDKSALHQFEMLSDEMDERKLLYFAFSDGEIQLSNFSDSIKVDRFLDLKKTKNTQWILIGLDGGIKSYGDQIISIEDLFRKIDSMPMRQSEIRRNGKDG